MSWPQVLPESIFVELKSEVLNGQRSLVDEIGLTDGAVIRLRKEGF